MEKQEMIDMVNAAGKTAPKLTVEYINSRIVNVQYHVFPETVLTVCCITLKNGFNVIGTNSPVSKDNWIEEIGKKESYRKAVDQIWELEGYLLTERLSQEDSDLSKMTGSYILTDDHRLPKKAAEYLTGVQIHAIDKNNNILTDKAVVVDTNIVRIDDVYHMPVIDFYSVGGSIYCKLDTDKNTQLKGKI